MQEMIQAWFQGGPSSRQSEEPASLLEGWKQYEAQSGGWASGDVEIGSSSRPPTQGTSASSSLSGLDMVNPFFKSASESVSGAWTSMSRNVQDLPSSIHKTAASMPSQQSFVLFVVLLASGVFFTFLAFTMFLPLIAIAPQKFAICFTIGSGLVMGAFFSLKGPQSQLESMLTAERLPFTLIYVGSMVATLYVSMVLHSYILSVIASGAQVLALGYYVISFFPGGAAGLRFLTSTFTSTARGVVGF